MEEHIFGEEKDKVMSETKELKVEEKKEGKFNSVRPFYLHQWLDVKDDEETWLEAQIIKMEEEIEKFKIHYKGYKDKYDEKLSMREDHPDNRRILPLHSETKKPGRIGNVQCRDGLALDVLDPLDNWLQAKIIAMDDKHDLVKVRYDDWQNESYDEWLPKDSYRLAPLGSKTDPTETSSSVTIDEKKFLPPEQLNTLLRATEENEEKFHEALKKTRNFIITAQEGDGNCLFRAVSEQVYGTANHHATVREKCFEYVESQAYFFESFVSDQSLEEYVAQRRNEGVWGGDLEIQAMSEIYNRPIEIYTYSTEPKRIYCSSLKASPIRLSYHFRSHYNSVICPATWDKGLLKTTPGEAEDKYIKKAARLGRRVHGEDDILTLSDREETETETLRAALEASRQTFSVQSLGEFDSAVQESLHEFELRMVQELKQAKGESAMSYAEEQMVDAVKKTSELDTKTVEEDMVAKVMQQSMEDEMRRVKEATMPNAVRRCISVGFPENHCLEAYHIFVNDSSLSEDSLYASMMEYLVNRKIEMFG